METRDVQGLPAQAGTLYRQFLTQLRQVTGAAGASLYIDGDADPSRTLLQHSGCAGAVPEFRSVDSAQQAIATLPAPGPDNSVLHVFPSSARSGCLLRIEIGKTAPRESVPCGEERRLETPAAAARSFIWVGLEFDQGAVPLTIMSLNAPPAGAPHGAAEWLAHTIHAGAQMLWESRLQEQLLRDPTSRLPGRAQFQARLRQVMDTTQGNARFGLLLVNPDEFDLVNRRLDRDSGDIALSQIANMLCDSLRRTDGVFRYGGAMFAVHLPIAGRDSLVATAEKLRHCLTGAYLDGAMRLSFSIGAALYDPEQEEDAGLDDQGLLRRADQALNMAKDRGGDCTALWQPGDAEHQLIGRDRLSGIFTADAEKDYRNMLLLWDTIAMVSGDNEVSRLASGFVERIQMAIRPAWTGLFSFAEGKAPDLLACSGRTGFAEGQEPQAVEQLLSRASALGRIESRRREAASGESHSEPRMAHAIPLLAAGKSLACLYLEGPEAELTLDSSDLVFLNALAGQLALALDRAQLAARWRVEKEQESRRLRSEVRGLRQAVQGARLVYKSLEMEQLLDTARAAAGTDVTTLIVGESGTGKEMLARSVHDMSDRNGKAFVTVDCGSIATNLIEAELFGALKGAFTGADRVSEGRIAQADGGTLFLDEIGEVPLDVQAKLLRFVQEKEIHPVGATTSRKVDVRIIAATNRDLAREAAGGRFREDLYYRLNVVTLRAPPLRERPDDILPLAGHFLERFALQYEKGPRRFSTDAERRLLAYAWPGNVRELQNAVLRAVVLSKATVLDGDVLLFDEPVLDTPPVRAAPTPTESIPETAEDLLSATGEPWQALGEELDKQVAAALGASSKTAPPLGRWLSEDLVLSVDARADGTARRAARRLGVAETTYRRQLEKARRQMAHGQLSRSDKWEATQRLINRLADSLDDETSTNVMEAAREQLLGAVANRVDGDDAMGSALMGITVPTYRRWLSQH